MLRTGRFGPYLQLGPDPTEKGGEKPKRASIPKGWAIDELDLEAALKLLALPREIGIHPETGKPITAGIGRYGPFVENAGKYANLDSVEEVFTVGANRAISLLAEKKSGRGRVSASALKSFGEHPTAGGAITVRSGRYGALRQPRQDQRHAAARHEARGRDARPGRRADRREGGPRAGVEGEGHAEAAQGPRQKEGGGRKEAAGRRRPRPRPNRIDLPRKPKEKRAELPTREAILEFVAEHPGKAGKREIARAFGLSGGEKIGLKRLLKEMADEGLIEGRRKRLHRPGDLPSVTVLSVEGIDDEGEPIGVPAEWDEEGGDAPRIVIAPESKGSRHRAPGIGDRVLARLTPEPETGGYTARVIRVLERRRAPRSASSASATAKRASSRSPAATPELVVSPDAAKGAQRRRARFGRGHAKRGRYGLPSGRVVERLGDVSSEKAVSLIALEEHGIPHVFPRAVLDAAEAAGLADMAHREDWRDLPLVTIDPADARDHDDAVHAAPDPEHAGRLRRHRRDRRRRLLCAPRLRARPRGGEARQLRLFPRPRRADAAGAHLQRPLLAARRRAAPGARRPHALRRRRQEARPRVSTAS